MGTYIILGLLVKDWMNSALLVKTISKPWVHIVMLLVRVPFILPRTVFLFIYAGMFLSGMIQLK